MFGGGQPGGLAAAPQNTTDSHSETLCKRRGQASLLLLRHVSHHEVHLLLSEFGGDFGVWGVVL